MQCYIVKDLLPGYVDGLISAETEKDVNDHLRDCSDCRLIYEQMKAPMDQTPFKADVKEINFLKRIKSRTIRSISIGCIAIIIVFGILAWIFAIGTPASSSDIAVYTNPLSQAGVITLELTNGKALNVKAEFTYGENAGGSKVATGFILKPYAIQPSKFLFEADNYTTGFDYAEEPHAADFTVTIRCKDKDVVYSVTDEGLLIPQ
ncbi:Putative zinc-finger [Sporobacter termitidis DSM 10068]|uniref:Putative zinc-finger n=1 Tax=Sporobacter termitidis DSM 10068 TaxID=1123282 RepID=A0A1M5URG3_9FIRM|nr:zf-HC2 domain-containing protein [Sporobacter termitidis]SHH65526.1 Putative zinc-finger [Sporobacter termitidis DSM 10068]